MTSLNKSVLSSLLSKVIDYRGKTPKKLDSDWVDHGYRAFSALNVKTSGLQKLDSIRCVDEITYKKWMKSEVEKGDLLLTSEAPAGEVMLWNSDEKIVLSQRLFALRVNSKINNKYLKYYLQSNIGQKEINKNTSGSTVFGISAKMFDQINVHYPAISSQAVIGNLLTEIDDKIQINNQISNELEVMSQLIYKYWFIQFDFPDANGRPYKSSGGKMIYNKELKREIPAGWGVKDLNNCIDIILDHRGKTPKKLEGDWTDCENGILALSAKLVKGGKLVSLHKAKKVDQELFDKWMPEKLMDGDILMTSEAPAGEFYFIQGKTDYCMSQRLFAIRADKTMLKPSYFYHELSIGHGYSQIMGGLSGSTVFGIRQDVLRTIKVVLPEMNLQKKFDEMVLPQLKSIKNLQQENIELVKIRDWLLPMLMNGQVTVNAS